MRHIVIPCLTFALGFTVASELGLSVAVAQDVPITNQARQAIAFYGGQPALNTLSEMPRRSSILPTSAGQISHTGKPFQTATTGSTVSPYLNLFRDENEGADAAPNYFAFVRPQMEQQAQSQQQQREIQQLQRQLQGGSAVGSNMLNRSSRVPGVGTSARFMDTAQFYGGWQR